MRPAENDNAGVSTIPEFRKGLRVVHVNSLNGEFACYRTELESPQDFGGILRPMVTVIALRPFPMPPEWLDYVPAEKKPPIKTKAPSPFHVV